MTTPTIDEKPWMVVRRHGEPVYFKTIGEARKRVLTDLEHLLDQFKRLNARDAIEHLIDAIELVNKQFGLSGGRLDVLVDPHTNTWYRVEVVDRRKGLE